MPTNKPRPDPVIPDHEVLRKIGGGSYGEVWLARGVTGALRAVKVVYREDFDDVRGFEREFEGILKFEPISRDHPGLVNILHVGRSRDSFSFYYYVMELGDDVTAGRDINPIEYEARTLSSDRKRTPGRRLPTEHCIDCGMRLAEALQHLHENGLAHRDVKPSNVIFVNGRAKLADIGLVATRGQRTFVGTEGFVPPEGPGSAQADIYSLGKVLYEIATGKDRLDFPELPDDLPTGLERKRWLALNQTICDICEPQLSKRTIATAGELADVLRRLQQGKRRRRRRPVGAFMLTLVVGGGIALGGWELMKTRREGLFSNAPVKPDVELKPETVLVKVVSTPSDADVFVVGGPSEKVGVTPYTYSASPGTVTYLLKKARFKDAYIKNFEIKPSGLNEVQLTPQVVMKNFTPPVPDQNWVDRLGQTYRPMKRVSSADASASDPVMDYHLMTDTVRSGPWHTYISSTKRSENSAEFADLAEGEDEHMGNVVLTTESEAKSFCRWMVETNIEDGFLTDRHEMVPVIDRNFDPSSLSERARKEGLRPFRCEVRTIPYARLNVITEPPGAEVYVSEGDVAETSRGKTGASDPLSIEDLKPGQISVYVVLEGFKPDTQKLSLKPGETKTLKYSLKRNNSVVMEKPWTNSLGMNFLPVPGMKDLMASIYETRRKDFQEFCKASKRPLPKVPSFSQTDDDPVVFVSRDDAEAFCRWLTEKEQGKGEERLTVNHVYRLPTDYEWSRLAGLEGEAPDVTPAQREAQSFSLPKRFLWSTQWPPPPRAGNLADYTAWNQGAISRDRTIENYVDNFPYTAPVGHFDDFKGFYDLAGNVNEWVSDNFNATVDSGVLRGGAWNTSDERSLYPWSRTVQLPAFSDDTYGFRVVLAKTHPVDQKTPEEPIPDDG